MENKQDFTINNEKTNTLNFSEIPKKFNVSENQIIDIPLSYLDRLNMTFTYIRENNKENTKISSLEEANTEIRKRTTAKKRVLQNPETAGFIAVSTLTVVATLLVSIIIFSVVGNIVRWYKWNLIY